MNSRSLLFFKVLLILFFKIFRTQRPKIVASVLDLIGETPMLRLNRIPKEEGIECEIRKLTILPLKPECLILSGEMRIPEPWWQR